jgi:hypothetical protein
MEVDNLEYLFLGACMGNLIGIFIIYLFYRYVRWRIK